MTGSEKFYWSFRMNALVAWFEELRVYTTLSFCTLFSRAHEWEVFPVNDGLFHEMIGSARTDSVSKNCVRVSVVVAIFAVLHF